MKNLIPIIASILFLITACNSSESENNFSCSYYGEAKITELMEGNSMHSFNSNSEAQNIANQILLQIGLEKNFKIIETNKVDNAAAIIHDNKRYILYNNEFMDLADRISESNWSSVSILAHEIGHHLQGHTLTNDGSRPDKELEADRFSGFILARLGASLEDVQKPILKLISKKGSPTHPSREKRLKAVTEGYESGLTKNPTVKIPKKENNSVPVHKVSPIDNNTISLDHIIWSNLDVEKQLPEAITHTYDNKIVHKYLYKDLKKLCPKGWRVANSKDWEKLNQDLIDDKNLRNSFEVNKRNNDKSHIDYHYHGARYWTADKKIVSFYSYKWYLKSLELKQKKITTVKNYKPGIIMFSDESDYAKFAWEETLKNDHHRCRCVKEK